MEELLLNEERLLGPEYNQKHVKFPLIVTEQYDYIKIQFEFSPLEVESSLAIAAIEKSIHGFYPAGYPIEPASEFLPVVNLLTVSAAYEGLYLGCRHHKSTKQEAIISGPGSSYGYQTFEVKPGQWEFQINCHCLLSKEVTIQLKVIGGTN